MFDITNEEIVVKLIDLKGDNNVIIPLYVKIDKDIYSILELDTISRFNPSTFKIGFGTSQGLFIKTSFTNKVEDLSMFDVIQVFNKHNEDDGSNIRYIVFESGYVQEDDNSPLYIKEINAYMDMLSSYVSQHVSELRKELIRKQMEEDNV